MTILVGCERSGVVRDAFRKHGHDAISCDLEPSDVGGPHYRGDVRDLFGEAFDLFIVHPPCTFTCSSGLHWNRRGRLVDGRPRQELTDEAVAFAAAMLNAPFPMVAMENPVGCLSTRIRKPDQIVQPYYFGEDASKATCLWLRGLPVLKSTGYVQPRMVCPVCRDTFDYHQAAQPCGRCGVNLAPRWSNQGDGGQSKLGPSVDRARLRSVTFPGIATAMAAQWGSVQIQTPCHAESTEDVR